MFYNYEYLWPVLELTEVQCQSIPPGQLVTQRQAKADRQVYKQAQKWPHQENRNFLKFNLTSLDTLNLILSSFKEI